MDQEFFGDDGDVRLQQRVLELRDWLKEHEAIYFTARQHSTDADWLASGLDACKTVYEAILEFDKSNDPPTAAVFILGQAQVAMGSVFGQLEIIAEYETNLRALEELKRALGVEE